MEMAAESNTGFHRQSLSFQSGVIGSSSSEMMLMGNYYSSLGMNFNVNNNGGGRGMLYSGNPTVITNGGRSSSNPGVSQSGSCSSSFLIDSVPGLKHDTGLVVEWTVEEQYKLDEGLIKFANEPSIMKYIKIAATLHDKTVRDVALRCRWMTRKRKKHEDYNLGTKVKDKKEKSPEVLGKTGTSSASPQSFIPYSLSSNHHDHGGVIPSAALLGTRHLLEENNQALHQISANLSTVKMLSTDHSTGDWVVTPVLTNIVNQPAHKAPSDYPLTTEEGKGNLILLEFAPCSLLSIAHSLLDACINETTSNTLIY